MTYIRAIMSMYEGTSTSVRTQDEAIDDFSITIELHQRSTVSPYLLTLILCTLAEYIQKLASTCMLFCFLFC